MFLTLPQHPGAFTFLICGAVDTLYCLQILHWQAQVGRFVFLTL